MTTIKIDQFLPNYQQECEVCGQFPCVDGVVFAGKARRKTKVIYHSALCGPCTFGTAEATDPETWNQDED